ECAPGPLVWGSSHHSEIEYRSPVSTPAALNTAEMRPIGYTRPSPGLRTTGRRLATSSSTVIATPSPLVSTHSSPPTRLHPLVSTLVFAHSSSPVRHATVPRPRALHPWRHARKPGPS